jgi:short-subunit dehydrogenase
LSTGSALITGASSGIGAELARLCAADGYALILVARREDRLRELAARLAAEFNVPTRVIALDLADAAAPDSLFEQTRGEPVKILINNAGFGLRGTYISTNWEEEVRLMQVNMISLAHLTKLFAARMKTQGGGRILNVGSTAAFVPGPMMAMYYASKAFVVSLSLAVANELRGTGVSVTVLCPGVTRTEFFDAAGIGDSTLLKGPAMTAAAVAKEGYRAMMAGKAEIIAGARNRLMILSTRLAPRAMLAGIARRLNASRD